MSDFSALYTGLSGILAHRRAAEVASHNIANVNTEGFSRQRAELKAEGRPAVAALYAKASDVGNGVRVDSIIRVRDNFLEAQHRSEAAIGAAIDGRTTVLTRLENAFPEPGDSGIAKQLDDYWAAWQAVATNPGDEPARAAVLEKGKQVASAFQLADRQIRTQHADAVTYTTQLVDEVNQLADQVVQYDTAIRSAIANGQQPNDLLDSRDQLALKISNLTGATVEQDAGGSVQIYVGGRALVYNSTVQKLAVNEVADPALTPLGLKKLEVSWAADGYPADLAGGEIAGYIEGTNEIIPRHLTQLDGVASTLVSTVNAIHSMGKGLDDAAPPVPPRNFFDPAGTTAKTLNLSADVANQPRNLSVADASKGALDTSVAEQLSKLGLSTTGADAIYHTMIVGLGSEVQFSQQQSEVQTSVVGRLDDDRKAVSGVNLDEEMVNLVAAQHAYAASARVITTIDEMLDTLINRTGVVGR